MATTFNVSAVRKHFPALDKSQVYFDNAGGSQTLEEVIDSVTKYLSSTNVQLGASYPVAQRSTDLFETGKSAAAEYINATADEIVLGPSTTQLFRNLSLSLFDHLTPGSEIILSKVDHEANVASWLQMASWRQLTIKWWTPDGTENPQLTPASLKPLLSPKTKLVACTHTSNILGTITDIPSIAATVHTIPGALLCVDGVAFAPHRRVNTQELGADIYAFSWYKVYGPHISVLYASKAAQTAMSSLGHYFKGSKTLEDKLGLAAANYELTASIPAVCAYLKTMPWDDIAAHEERLQGLLIDYLVEHPDRFQIWGEPVRDRSKRVPVISFTVKGWKSRDVVEKVEAKSGFGFRWGAFYSNRLVKEVLGLDDIDGVVRVSLVHYNTEDEIKDFVKVLDEVLSS